MKRKDAWFVALILLALVIVFFQLFTLEKSFLSGDHREQQYPWAQFYQSAIRHFHLPWWTTRIHCGFPLLAEGQIGAFYPLNFIFLFFLPLKIAYNYEILFQYFLGALLFYSYLRRSGISDWGSFFAALIYLFGSTQGGYFYYNLISQKTVIWLPLTLILLDRLKREKSWNDGFFLALVFAVQLFAGYLQVAVYSIGYSCLYFTYLWWQEKSGRFLALFAASGAAAVFFSLVQLLPTFELAMLSSRAHAIKDLAYVGSMTPLGWLTLFYPSWDGFLGSEFYVGILGFFFVLVSLFSGKESREKFFAAAAVFFLLLALGKFSPLYRAIIEVTHFYSFRTPIKFLFFVTFSCAVLAGFGFDKFFNREELRNKYASPQVLSGYRFFMVLGGLMLLLPFLTHLFLEQYRPYLLPFLKRYVADHIYGQAGHPHPLDFYMQKAEGFYEQVIQLAGLSSTDTRIEWGLLGFCLTFVRSAWLVPEKFLRKYGKWLCCLVLFMDLFLYGFTSIKPNYGDFRSFDTPAGKSAIVDYLKKDISIFRVMEVYQESSENEKYPLFPNFNMLYGMDDIGVYSPLVMKAYRNFLEGWGYTNDSLSISWVDPRKVEENLSLLSFLNVKYILSTKPLSARGLIPVTEENGITLYRNDTVLPRAFFLPRVFAVDSMTELKNIQPVDSLNYDQNRVSLEINAPEDGLLVLSDIAYPGWWLRVNGKPADFSKALKLFRATALKKGKNEVVFEYGPVMYRWLGLAALLTALAWSAVLVWQKAAGRGVQV